MTKGLNIIHPLPPVYENWLKYAMVSGTPEDVTKVVIGQQEALQRLADFNSKTPFERFMDDFNKARLGDGYGLDYLNPQRNGHDWGYLDPRSSTNSFVAMEKGWKPPF